MYFFFVFYATIKVFSQPIAGVERGCWGLKTPLYTHNSNPLLWFAFCVCLSDVSQHVHSNNKILEYVTGYRDMFGGYGLLWSPNDSPAHYIHYIQSIYYWNIQLLSWHDFPPFIQQRSTWAQTYSAQRGRSQLYRKLLANRQLALSAFNYQWAKPVLFWRISPLSYLRGTLVRCCETSSVMYRLMLLTTSKFSRVQAEVLIILRMMHRIHSPVLIYSYDHLIIAFLCNSKSHGK